MVDQWSTQQTSYMPDTSRQNHISDYYTFSPHLLLTLPARPKSTAKREEPGTGVRASQFRPMHPPPVVSSPTDFKPTLIQKGPYYGGWVQVAMEMQSQVWNQPTMRISPIPLASTARGMSATGSLLTSSQRQNVWTSLRPWFYRGWLLVTTVGLSLLLLWLQGMLDSVPSYQPTSLQVSVRWAELTWLMPVPLALILWVGWFIFTEAVRPAPVPIDAPIVTFDQKDGPGIVARPVRLVFRFVTRGENVSVLRNSLMAVSNAFARYHSTAGTYRIEIVSERLIALETATSNNMGVYVVPQSYATKKGSRFKARALTYLQEQVYPGPQDWYVYLDEESTVNEGMLAGIYRFIWQSIMAEQQAKSNNNSTGQQGRDEKHGPTGVIGQGAILYQGGNWFFRGADALRTADDIGRFRLQYALGAPIFGVHGSFLVVRGLDEARLSFDVGSENSITEDTAWALQAWSQGFRFAWVGGYLREQPPQRVMDFIKQRSRWLSGLRMVLRDHGIPVRYRICLGIFTTLWQFTFLPLCVAIAALFVHVSPFVWMRLPADFAWATFVLAYFQGIDVQSTHLLPAQSGKAEKRKAFFKRLLSWPLLLCFVWYALLEAISAFYSLRSKKGFYVIHKPDLGVGVPHQDRQGRRKTYPGSRRYPAYPGVEDGERVMSR